MRKFALIEQFGFKNYQMKEILINGTHILGRNGMFYHFIDDYYYHKEY